jgi:hypothetical protein
MIIMATITVNDLATELESTPREVRKFLRSPESGIEPVGKGSRYAIEKREVRALKSRYAKLARRPKRTTRSNRTPRPTTDRDPDAPLRGGLRGVCGGVAAVGMLAFTAALRSRLTPRQTAPRARFT